MQAGPLLCQIIVELQSRHPCFNGHVHVCHAEPLDPIHLLNVDADSTPRRHNTAFNGSPGAEGNDRNSVLRADLHGRHDVVSRRRLDHHIRSLRRVMGRILPMLQQNVRVCCDPFPKSDA